MPGRAQAYNLAMLRLPPSRLLVATLVAVAALGVRAEHGAERSHASQEGLIVFASDRAKLNDGEIYSLAAGTQARDITRSLAGEHDLAVSPRGDLIAFWSDRSGFDRIYLAHGDGSAVRLVPGIGVGQTPTHQGDGGRLQFSGQGSLLIAGYSTGTTTNDYAIDTRSLAARLLPLCGFVVAPSPDGRLIACGRSGTGPVSVYDSAGRVRFRVPVSQPLWSSRGWLTGSPTAAAPQSLSSWSTSPVARSGTSTVCRSHGRRTEECWRSRAAPHCSSPIPAPPDPLGRSSGTAAAAGRRSAPTAASILTADVAASPCCCRSRADLPLPPPAPGAASGRPAGDSRISGRSRRVFRGPASHSPCSSPTRTAATRAWSDASRSTITASARCTGSRTGDACCSSP